MDPIKKNTNCFSSESNPRGRSQGRKSLMASYLSDFSGEKPPARPRRQSSPMVPPSGTEKVGLGCVLGAGPAHRRTTAGDGIGAEPSPGPAPGKARPAARGDSRRAGRLGGSAPALSPAFPRAPTHRAGSLQRWRRQRQEPGIQNGGSGTKAPIPQAEEFCGRHLLVYLRLDAAVTR